MKSDELTETVETEVVTPAVRPSMKERQWQLREDAILDAATELLKTKGFNAMTLEDITEAIGISRPTLYLHFKSKEDVATRVATRNLCCVRTIFDSLDPTQSPGQRLRMFSRKAMEIRFDPTRIPMYDLTRIKLSQACHDVELRKLEDGFYASLAELIREGQESGEIWNGVRPEILALLAVGFLKSLEIEVMVEDGRTTPAEIEQTLERLFFDRI
jgi:AcrR family transcriptional regulator